MMLKQEGRMRNWNAKLEEIIYVLDE